MASGSPDVHGSRCETAATAPATAPRTAVAADARAEGSAFGRLLLVPRVAAARAADLRRAVPAAVGVRFAVAFLVVSRLGVAAARRVVFALPAGRFLAVVFAAGRLVLFAARRAVFVLAGVRLVPARLPAAGLTVFLLATLPPVLSRERSAFSYQQRPSHCRGSLSRSHPWISQQPAGAGKNFSPQRRQQSEQRHVLSGSSSVTCGEASSAGLWLPDTAVGPQANPASGERTSRAHHYGRGEPLTRQSRRGARRSMSSAGA